MSIPFALSLSKYVNSTGTDVGFGSLLAVALLALLYFAGARETRTLREQLEDAHTRITALEARLAQSLRNQAARAQQAAGVPNVPGRPGVVPPPAAAMGSTVAAIQRQAAAAAAVPAGALVGATMGSAAPSLGSATKLIPSPALAPVPVPAVTPAPVAVPGVAVPAAAAVGAGPETAVYAGGGDTDEFEDEFGPEHTLFVPAERSAAAAANGRGNGGGAAVAAPPRVQLYDDEADSGGPPPRRTIPLVDNGPSRTRVFAGRLGGSIAAIVVVAIIVVALLLITSSGGAKHKSSTTASRQTQTTQKKRLPVFDPAKVKVSVLNGTGFTGLAGDVGKELTSAGYKVPAAAITNDGGQQTVSSTTVDYRTGYGNAAVHIAQALAKANHTVLPETMPATQAELVACGTPVTGQAGACPANVIVTVGEDLSSLSSSSGNSGNSGA